MTVESHNARSMPTPARVMGVRPVKAFVPPTMSMHDDAKLCNAAMHRHNGMSTGTPPITWDMHVKYKADIRQERFAAIRPMLEAGPANLNQIADAWGLKRGGISYLIKLLVEDGLITRDDSGQRVVISLAVAK